MSNQLIPVSDAVIVRQENISTIVQAGPQSYQTNLLSCQRCNEAGQQLLDEIERCGMSDDLDRRLAEYIVKVRKTVTKMNERRSPVTKLFDQVRSEFTILENSIDPTKKDTVPFRIAQYRNAYAAKKREEEERRRQAELAAQELIKAKEGYRAAVEEDYRRSFNNLVTGSINELTKINSGVNLDNYTAVFDTVTGYQSTLPADWCPPSAVRLPYNLTPEEAKEIRNVTFQRLLPNFEEQFVFEVDEYRREILDKLPSKKIELERMAEATLPRPLVSRLKWPNVKPKKQPERNRSVKKPRPRPSKKPNSTSPTLKWQGFSAWQRPNRSTLPKPKSARKSWSTTRPHSSALCRCGGSARAATCQSMSLPKFSRNRSLSARSLQPKKTST